MAKSTKKHYEDALNKGANPAFPFSDKYFQSADFNQRTFSMYRQWLTSIALNRFRWVNLPPTVSERYLEQTLYYNGCATIARYPETDITYALQAIVEAYPNAQDDYDRWGCLGQNGTVSFDADVTNAVLVWDNRQRMPTANVLDLFARRLTTMDRTLDINMLQQRVPLILSGPQEKTLDVANVAKAMAGGEFMIVGYDDIRDLVHLEGVQTGIPCLADEISTAWKNVWNNAMRFLGVPVVEEKSERLIAAEAKAAAMPADLTALDPLTARREACDAYNRVFANSLVQQYGPIDVYWRQDNESDSFNFVNNVEKQEESNARDL